MNEHTKQPNQTADSFRISPASIVVGALATNCWLYPLIEPGPVPHEQDQPCAVIDPGADPDVIIARLKRFQLYPKYVLLTHGHFDHVAGIPGLVSHFSHTGKALEIAIHHADASYLGPEAYRVHQTAFRAVAGNSAYVDALWESIPAPTKLLTEGDRIGPFTVLHLPGHSPGSIGLYDAEMKLLFSGDTLFKHGMGRTDLPGGDWDGLQKSLERLFALDGRIRVYPGHGPETTIAAEQWQV
ncbi:MAG: MBL fold metallo-hydrolase [Treponema sp.]|jgi:glyoxylase-like metal-dependent hydrolase (beta-lactamase superfamily II)|nr:MBL fold metallo-hydrolase [Treponema sp.]